MREPEAAELRKGNGGNGLPGDGLEAILDVIGGLTITEILEYAELLGPKDLDPRAKSALSHPEVQAFLALYNVGLAEYDRGSVRIQVPLMDFRLQPDPKEIWGTLLGLAEAWCTEVSEETTHLTKVAKLRLLEAAKVYIRVRYESLSGELNLNSLVRSKAEKFPPFGNVTYIAETFELTEQQATKLEEAVSQYLDNWQ
jgi:hypothetical protein